MHRAKQIRVAQWEKGTQPAAGSEPRVPPPGRWVGWSHPLLLPQRPHLPHGCLEGCGRMLAAV